eukprot:gene15943-16150_t
MVNGPLDRTVAFLEKTDGRDKALKALSNYSKFLAWRYTL